MVSAAKSLFVLELDMEWRDPVITWSMCLRSHSRLCYALCFGNESLSFSALYFTSNNLATLPKGRTSGIRASHGPVCWHPHIGIYLSSPRHAHTDGRTKPNKQAHQVTHMWPTCRESRPHPFCPQHWQRKHIQLFILGILMKCQRNKGKTEDLRKIIILLNGVLLLPPCLFSSYPKDSLNNSPQIGERLPETILSSCQILSPWNLSCRFLKMFSSSYLI